MTEWNERVAVITGGASGIGLGMARAFGARGMKLVLADLDEALLQEASEDCVLRVLPLKPSSVMSQSR